MTLDVTPVTDTTTVTLNNNIIDTNVVQNGDVADTSNWTTSGAISSGGGWLQFGSGSANSDGVAEQGIYLNDGLDYSVSLDYWRIGQALTESALIEVIDSATGGTLFSQSVSTNSASAQTLNANFTTTSAGFATLRISDTSSGSRPSTDLGIDNISLIPEAANNAGYTPTVSVPEDQPVPVELAIANPDTDGSETLVIQLTGIPSGIQLSDGTNNFTATGAAIDVSSWNLNNLVLTPPANYDNDFTMTATATATETATGTPVVTNQAINIHIQDINAPPVIATLSPITDVDASFSFSEGTGTTAADISGNSHDLSMSGSATWGTSHSGSGTAFEMNGTSGAGEISGLQTGGEMTIAAWVRFDSFSQSWSRIIDFGDGAASDNILLAHPTTTNDLRFDVHESNGTVHALTVSNFFTAGEWVHVTATIDNTGLMTVYKNGVEAGSLQGALPTEKVRSSNYVGKSNWPDGYLDGAIDDLAVISGALDATAVSNLYQASELSDFVDANFVIDENSSNGTVVAQLSANDEEDGTNVTYTLVNNAGGRFAISNTELGNYATAPSERTISLFFKLDPSNSKDGKQVLYEEGGSSHGFAIYLDNGKIYVGGWENSNTAYVNTDITYLDSDNWHHIALVMNDNANTLRGFLDGEIFGNAAGITVPAHSGIVAFGGPSAGSETFDFHDLDDGLGTNFHGQIDEGRVYNRALTEAEVQVMGQLDQTDTFTYEVSDGTHTSTSNLEINTLHTLDTINDIQGSNGVNDTLNGTLFSERLRGFDGDDTLNAGGGDDRLIGGAGDDILTGGSGEDVFKFNLGDIGTAAIPAQDTITDFNMSEGDSLDLSSILVDEENNDLTQYLSFDQADPANPIVEVRDTADGDITQKITLQGVDLSLLGSTDAEIINNMLNSGNLSTD
ncbi:hypothetical protein CAPTEDRAFT_211867 [Capitella teleta]|uniref:Cadherin domain-containing protein n=1 Tax=Capitella teleta TaxID=283909 RepID=R7UAE6_CAPTE|nr:hypothetical protein CAPTEDRAFT_211867 [Capitella teleta]|eukprot:ELU00116.1 hypothetical protein CAPTEDRAFT_211867 [Capitella teleta]